VLEEYFDNRHWKHDALENCVARGMELAKQAGEPFTWLTCTNAGASEVCEAALSLAGVTAAELKAGMKCDPNTRSDLRIVAKPGIVIRLSRNFDKQRGFVNGALATIVESLRGNEVFTARLLGTGNMVLVHPLEEQQTKFLPCCYGYATTIRRAQGADLHHGCVYMDQKYRLAARGYAYVACSRFKTRAGCYLYKKLRQSDFLPVGEEREDEVLERGLESQDSDEEGPTEEGYNPKNQDSGDDSDPEKDEGNALQRINLDQDCD
jgi:hypothetical protein